MGKPEAELVRNIAIHILNTLGDNGSSIPEDSVGLRPRMEKVISLMKLDLDDPRMVGICGMGGIGKTTIAKAVYHQICSQFVGRCYLANARETSEKDGLESLQKSLLADIRSVSDSEIKIRNIDLPGTLRNAVQNKRVLVVLDDVDHLKQLDALVGRLDWFGRGSRIIITTRDSHLLAKYGPVYNVETLNHEEAFKLFCCEAFGNNQPTQGYEELTESFVCYAGGVPLALRVLGSLLFDRSIIEWQSGVDKLRHWPNADIQAVLKLSYDGLDHEEREIFLDIACFHKRMSKDYVIEILDACGFHAHIGISVLEGKALVTIRDNMIDMHDLVQEMGRHIVYEESPKESGGTSRLWNYEEICHTLTKKTGTEAVEAIVLNSYGRNEISLSPDAFSKMSKLRLLQLGYFQLPNGLDYLSSDLCCLNWWGYPLEYLPSNFQSNSLVKLNLSHSRLKQLWNGGMVTNLKELVLEGCMNLVEIGPSIEASKRLTLLNLRGWKNLKVLPTRWWLKSLKKLVLSDCSRLENISEVLASATECLVWLELDNTCVKELLVGHLISLESISFQDCNELTSLSSGICGLKRLEHLLVSGCSKLSKLPENIGGLESLLELRADHTAIKQLPFSITHLKKLVYLSFQGCKGGVTSSLWNSLFSSCLIWKDSQDLMGFELPPLSGLSSLTTLILGDCIFSEGFLPNDLGFLSSLSYLNLSGSNIISLPDSIGGLGQLSGLDLSGSNIISLPDSIGDLNQLSNLDLSKSSIISLPDSIGGLDQLFYLNLSGSNIISLPDSIGGLGQLSYLNLSSSNIISLPDSIGGLDRVCIYFTNCKKLKMVSYLPTCTSYLAASGCTSLETLPELPMLSSLIRMAALSNCHTLVENRPNLLLELLRNNLKLLSLSDSVSCPARDKVTCTEGFAFVAPGRDISKCFSYQNDMGHYVRIHLMPDWYQRLRGFVLCAAFKAKAPSIGAKVSVEYYHMDNDDLVHASLTNICDFQFQSDHLVLCYLTRERLYESYFSEIKNDVNGRPEIIIFYFKSSSLMFAPTKCAVHMVYENEEVWPDLQTSIQQSGCDEFYENDEEWPGSHASIQRSSCDEFQWGDSQSELLETSIENIRAKFINRLYRHD